ncbi:TPA: alternative ribosome-rescue factor A [Mannheimia haemolytica]
MEKQNQTYHHSRGEIKESAVKALVTDPLFRHKIERNRKGKGSYRRTEKHKKAGYQSEAPFKNLQQSIFKWGFFI